MCPKLGMLPVMSDYYADPRISHSKLKEIRKSPAYFLHKLREPTKETDAMKLGTLCHMAVLEPDKLEQNYIALEEKIDRRTKEGKAAWAALQEASEGKVVVQPWMWEVAKRVSESVMGHPMAAMLVNECLSEGSCEAEFRFSWDGVDCKSKLDGITAGGTVIDLKTTQDADPAFFAGEIYKRYYHTQAAFYRRALKSANRRWSGHTFIVVEVEAPYQTSIIRVTEEGVDIGENTVRQWLGIYRTCNERGEWPGYGECDAPPPKWLVGTSG